MRKWKCQVCGQEFEGDAPPVPCPVCGAGAEAFEEVVTGTVQWRCMVCGQVFEGSEPPVPCPVCGAGREAFERLVVPDEELFRQDTDEHFLLVGGGLAALEAAKAIRARNKTARITILSGENHPPYNRPALSQVVADGLSFVNILLEEEAYYAEHGIELRMGAVAEAVDAGAKTVRLAGGESIAYDKLLLATGSSPFNPIPPAEGSIPVKVLRCYEDAVELLGQPRGCRVVLVGGGILGLEAAAALRGRGAKVTVVELAERLLHIQADEVASQRLRAKLEDLGIEVVTGASVTAAEAGGVLLSDGRRIGADLVLASLGVRSEVGLATALGLNIGRGIVVDGFMHTSLPGIWAAGDCAEFGGRVQAIAGAAASMGAVAGASMAGEEKNAYTPFTPATAYTLPGGFSLFSAGSVGGSEWATYQDERSGDYRRLFFQRGVLVGAVYLGPSPSARVIGALGAETKLADALGLLGH